MSRRPLDPPKPAITVASWLHVRILVSKECHRLSLRRLLVPCTQQPDRSSRARTWSFYVSDDASTCVIHELDSDLCDTSSRPYAQISSVVFFSSASDFLKRRSHTCSAQYSCHLHQLDGNLASIHIGIGVCVFRGLSSASEG